MKLSYEYNEFVIGYVVTDENSGRSLNFQFEQAFSNHPEPAWVLKAGCEGDETHEKFSQEEIEEARTWLRAHPGVSELEEAFTTAYYAGTLPEGCEVSEDDIIAAAAAAATGDDGFIDGSEKEWDHNF